MVYGPLRNSSVTFCTQTHTLKGNKLIQTEWKRLIKEGCGKGYPVDDIYDNANDDDNDDDDIDVDADTYGDFSKQK